jgi:hypothetical protein
MGEVKIHKSGEDLIGDRFIGVNKKANGKIEIKGAVIRLEVRPGEYATSEPDYKVSVWVPNETYGTDKGKKGGKQFELNTKSNGGNYSFYSAKDIFAALVEAATGAKPSNGTERITKELFGFGMDIYESEEKSKEIIGQAVDPLTEVITLPKEETKAQANVTVAGSAATAGHQPECDCWHCEDVRKEQAKNLYATVHGKAAPEQSPLPAELSLHPMNCNCYRCLQSEMGMY